MNSPMKQIKVQVGILMPRNSHWISAQLPDAVNTDETACQIDEFSIIICKLGPQSGTNSGGKPCIHTCLPAMPMPMAVVMTNAKPINLRPQYITGLKLPSKNNTPMAKKTTRWSIHKLQGIKNITCSTYRAYASKPAQARNGNRDNNRNWFLVTVMV